MSTLSLTRLMISSENTLFLQLHNRHPCAAFRRFARSDCATSGWFLRNSLTAVFSAPVPNPWIMVRMKSDEGGMVDKTFYFGQAFGNPQPDNIYPVREASPSRKSDAPTRDRYSDCLLRGFQRVSRPTAEINLLATHLELNLVAMRSQNRADLVQTLNPTASPGLRSPTLTALRGADGSVSMSLRAAPRSRCSFSALQPVR